ncbi:hypothetical protein [Haloplanus natans]|uniref:hypothetical protein n=1 Tax=Haloplanus natans TaxID=376171 RepID=UPI00067769A4|nr:hypothetical protein [Haloplanus natans]
MLVVKTADIASTFLLAKQYSWEMEAGYTMIGYLGPALGHVPLALATIPIAVLVGYYAYDQVPAGAEFAVLYFAWISVGNFTQLWLPLIGTLWNVAGLPILVSVILARGFDPIWFDRSPTRDELLENIEAAKAWKTRLFGGDQGAV